MNKRQKTNKRLPRAMRDRAHGPMSASPSHVQLSMTPSPAHAIITGGQIHHQMSTFHTRPKFKFNVALRLQRP